MSVTNVSGLGATAKLELQDTNPSSEFEGRMLFENHDGKVKITCTRKRPGGREHSATGELDLSTLEHIVAVLKGEVPL